MAMEHSATVFHVRDLDASLKYYAEVLGFTQDFRFEHYAGIKSGPVCLHLAGGGNGQRRPVGGGTVYIFCDDVDAYYAEIKKKGAILKGEPKDWPYGMRDFQAVDPDGNILGFGCEVAKTES